MQSFHPVVACALAAPFLLLAAAESRRAPATRTGGQPAVRTIAADPTELLQLAMGGQLPKAFDAVGGRGLRLIRRTPVDAPGAEADGLHLAFEHPLSPSREASLLVRDGRITGFVTTGLLLQEVTTTMHGRLEVRPPLPGSDLACAADGVRRPGGFDGASAQAEGSVAGAGCDSGSVIDVFVGYTDAAVSQAGGATQMLDQILWAVGDSNSIYAASGVAQSIRLVGTELAAGYLEDSGSMANDLYALQAPADGALDGVLASGVAAGADLVALVRANGGNACGIAFLVGGSVEQVDYGVSVTALGCFSNRTFTHELGHNMGCCHAPGDGGGCTTGGVFPYSTGHRFFGTNGSEYRTVMAYQPGTRIGRFSSPLVSYEGTPTGIADERDNARSLNETRFVVANFRCTPCPGDLDGDRDVDGADIATLLAGWGVGSATGDLNADGDTNGADLATLLGNWGACD